MRRPIRAITATSAIAISIVGIVALFGFPFVAPIFAQPGASLLEGSHPEATLLKGTAAFGDWRAG